MRESTIESYLIKRVKELKGEIRKVKWIGRNAAMDRLVLLNGGYFVEVKRPGEKPRASQVREHDRFRKHGVPVWVVSTFDEVDCFINEILAKETPRNSN